MGKEELEIILKARDEVSGKLQGVGKEVGRLGQAFSLLNPAVLGATIGIGGFIAGLGKAVSGAEDDAIALEVLVRKAQNFGDTQADLTEKVQAFAEAIGSSARFTRDEVVEALGVAITRLHDYGKAQQAVNDAQNLALVSGMPLKEATGFIALAMQGFTRALVATSREIGINVKEGADLSDVLGEVNKAAEGLSDIYDTHLKGKLSELKEKFEEWGEAAAGPLVDGLNAVADTINKILGLTKEADKVMEESEFWKLMQAELIPEAVIPWENLGKDYGAAFQMGFQTAAADVLGRRALIPGAGKAGGGKGEGKGEPGPEQVFEGIPGTTLMRLEKARTSLALQLPNWKEIYVAATEAAESVTTYSEAMELATVAARNLSEMLASTLTDVIWGVEKDWKKAFSSMAAAFGQMITKMLIEFAALQALKTLFNWIVPGSGKLLGGLSSGIPAGGSAGSAGRVALTPNMELRINPNELDRLFQIAPAAVQSRIYRQSIPSSIYRESRR